ncbi:MAG: hypothetical protein IH985_04890 [Planctomycetes bacterium]|nr:hypothetical protein [Planctomycetota bacterium]
MKNPSIRFLVGAAVVVAVLSMYLFVDTVRFNEKAVVTTFGQATQSNVRSEPGPFIKIPIINTVTKYDTRARVVRTLSVTQQTADSRPLIVQAFCVWRVNDPLKFFQAFSNAGPRAANHYDRAENEVLRDSLRAALSEVGQYRMNELFSPGNSAIPALEGSILAALRTEGPDDGDSRSSLEDKGIEILYVGISKALLPQSTTETVFERMQANRAARVSSLEARGRSEADAIIAKARADAERIRQFALARAAEIKSRGDMEAQQWLAQLKENPRLAVFLRNMEFVNDVTAKRITLVLPDDAPGLGVLSPSTGARLQPGDIPGVSWLDNMFDQVGGTEVARGRGEVVPVQDEPESSVDPGGEETPR